MTVATLALSSGFVLPAQPHPHVPPCLLVPLQKQKGSDYVNPRQGSFLPPSLASFSWPIDVWDLVVG